MMIEVIRMDIKTREAGILTLQKEPSVKVMVAIFQADTNGKKP